MHIFFGLLDRKKNSSDRKYFYNGHFCSQYQNHTPQLRWFWYLQYRSEINQLMLDKTKLTITANKLYCLPSLAAYLGQSTNQDWRYLGWYLGNNIGWQRTANIGYRSPPKIKPIWFTNIGWQVSAKIGPILGTIGVTLAPNIMPMLSQYDLLNIVRQSYTKIGSI